MLVNFVWFFLNKKFADETRIILLSSSDPDLKPIVERIAKETGILLTAHPTDTENVFIFKFYPSNKLELQFDHSNFAEGFTESIIRNIEKIWLNEFEVCGENCKNDLDGNIVKICIPPNLYSKIQWFIYLFLDGLAYRRIGRRWIR